MASLALALGLADAVKEEAGGFDLGTLFVDEGFGTLDDERLEEVLAVLDGLREGGRAVGVVSHVAELRSRISSQVVVPKGACGSPVGLPHRRRRGPTPTPPERPLRPTPAPQSSKASGGGQEQTRCRSP